MKCPACGTENAEGARFCNNCGSSFAAYPQRPSIDEQPTPTPTNTTPAAEYTQPIAPEQAQAQTPEPAVTSAPMGYGMPVQGGYAMPQTAFVQEQKWYQKT